MLPFVFAVLFIPSFNVLSGHFYVSLSLVTVPIFRGVLPYIGSVTCRPGHRVGFLRRFGLKTDIHFSHFGLESGMVFEGTTGLYERLYRFNSK